MMKHHVTGVQTCALPICVKESVKQPGTNAFINTGTSTLYPNEHKLDKSSTPVCTDPEALAWAGWGTALKPAHEPIALARKPIKTSIRENCLKYGTGALNIDATRIPYDDPAEAEADAKWRAKWGGNQTGGAPVFQDSTVKKKDNLKGLKAKQGAFSNHINAEKNVNEGLDASKDTTWEASQIGRFPANVIGEIEGYQKYFYCPKVSRKERHIGFPADSKGANIDANTHGKTPFCDDCQKTFNGSNDHGACDPALKTFKEKRNQHAPDGNNHPTVKPIELMKYLIKLITPPGGTVLDPFNGSGSTGCAAVELGHTYIGCELDPAYVAIAQARIEAWYEATRDPAVELFE
jgi:site-specific DNA-methyltransferase (adenine-specific)